MAEFVRTRISRSKDPIVVYSSIGHEIGYKPKGFWYSVDRDWERWCTGDMPEWLDGTFVHDVTLGAENMLFIRTIPELEAFHAKFRAPLPGRPRYFGDYDYWIDWPAVAAQYDGIEIAPYQWEHRLDGPISNWYYPWDCASGVVWNPKGIKVEYVGEYKKEGHCDHGTVSSS